MIAGEAFDTAGIRIGLTVDQRAISFGATTLDELLLTARMADASPQFQALFCPDSLLAKPRMEAISLLSAIAAQTERVTLGTACMASMPLRHPIWLAFQWATLDLISGGRTILAGCIGGAKGQGSGAFQDEFAAMGVDTKTRAQRMEEVIEVLRRLWTEDSVSHHGAFFDFDGVSVDPKPAQAHVPIWVTSNTNNHETRPEILERPLRRAARIADGWQTAASLPTTVRANFKAIREFAAEYGRGPDDLDCCVQLIINVNDDENAAFAEVKSYLDDYYEADWRREDLVKWGPWGSVETCAQRLAEYARAGATYITLRLATRNRLEMFHRVESVVLPRLREILREKPPQ